MSAQANLGYCYLHGKGVQRNEAEAEKWFRLGAMGGDKTAVATLAERYATGRGLIQSTTAALEWNRLVRPGGWLC